MKPIETVPYFTAVTNELAHTTAQIVWHAQLADYAIVASVLPQYGPWYHLFVELDGEWIINESSFSNWLPYDTPEKNGVFVNISRVNKQVRRGRVSYREQIIESQVNEKHLCTVIWDVDGPTQQNRLNYLELLVEENWQECIVSWYPTTAQQFAEAYRQFCKSGHKSVAQALKDKNLWASNMLHTDNREEKLKLALAIIDYADLSRDELVLACVGAGPLEDLMSDWLLDRLEELPPNNLKLKHALRTVRMESEEKSLQQRVARLIS